MVTMGAVWDRTSAVLSGRTGMLAGIAVPTLFLPTIVRDGYVIYAGPAATGFALIGGMLSLIVTLVMLWGQLALIAASSDPATDRSAATGIATNRFLPAIGVSLVLLIAVLVTLIPMVALIGVSGIDFAALRVEGHLSMAHANGGLLAAASIYGIIWLIAMLFVGARIAVWQPVLVNERLGVRSIARAWHLSRGATWRIVGVLLLFGIVLFVASGAAQFIVGIVFRLILGADHIATSLFLAGIAGSAVSTVFIVIAIVFTTQLYRAFVGTADAAAADAVPERS